MAGLFGRMRPNMGLFGGGYAETGQPPEQMPDPFGRATPYQFGGRPQPQPPMLPPMEQEQPQRRGMFGSGFMQKAGDVGAILRDDPGIWDNRQQMQAQQMNAQAEAAARAQQAQMDRMAKREDWQWQQDYQREHPAPVNNDTVNDYGFIKQTLGEEAANQYLQRLGDPMINTTLPNGAFYSGPGSRLPSVLGAGGGSPDTTPITEDGYSYTPGPGGRGNQANWKPVAGGQGAPAVPFPGR
jgi:hypothetical protein